MNLQLKLLQIQYEYSDAFLNSSILYLRQHYLVETVWHKQVQASKGPVVSCCNNKNDLTGAVPKPTEDSIF